MKKSLIVTGAASLAMAAMPVVGAFAADPSSQSFTDNINVTVPSGCTMETSGTTGAGTYSNRTFTFDITPGSYKEFGNTTSAGDDDDTISVNCNIQDSNKSWSVKATASNNGAAKAALKTTGDTPEYILGGTATSGTASAWAMKLEITGTDAGSAESTFRSFAEVPAAEATVLSAATNSVVSFRPVYRVYVGTDQEPGAYAGSVVYTIQVQN